MLRKRDDGLFELVSSKGKVLGIGRVEDGRFVNEIPHRRARKKIKIRAVKSRKPPHPGLVPGAWKKQKLGHQVLKSGVVIEQSLWESVVVVVKTFCGDLRRDFKRYCRRHGITATPIYPEPDVGERWPHTLPYQCSGGPALEGMCTYIPPDFVHDWYYVMNVGVPQLVDHGTLRDRKPAFKWHEAGGDVWVRMDLEKLQEMGISLPYQDDEITSLMGLVGKDHTTPYLWRVGCKAPVKWSFAEDKWVDASSLPDRGKVPKLLLVKEWYGQAYMFYWVSLRGDVRSEYFPDPITAETMLSQGCKWYPGEYMKGGRSEPERRGGGMWSRGADQQDADKHKDGDAWIGK